MKFIISFLIATFFCCSLFASTATLTGGGDDDTGIGSYKLKITGAGLPAGTTIKDVHLQLGTRTRPNELLRQEMDNAITVTDEPAGWDNNVTSQATVIQTNPDLHDTSFNLTFTTVGAGLGNGDTATFKFKFKRNQAFNFNGNPKIRLTSSGNLNWSINHESDTLQEIITTGGGNPVLDATFMASGSIFPSNEDIYTDLGSLGETGDFIYDGTDNIYVVFGSGSDIWGTGDNFHYLYLPIEHEDEFSIKATMRINPGASSSDWAKAGVMIRDTLEPDSSYAYALMRAFGGDILPQWREFTGSPSEGLEELTIPGTISEDGYDALTVELQRDFSTINFFYYEPLSGEKMEWYSQDIEFISDLAYVGLAVTSHEPGVISMGVFSDVSVTIGGEPVLIHE